MFLSNAYMQFIKENFFLKKIYLKIYKLFVMQKYIVYTFLEKNLIFF